MNRRFGWHNGNKNWTQCFVFSQLFSDCWSAFFFILSPLLYRISPLFSVLSLMSQTSPTHLSLLSTRPHPRSALTHPPLINLTRPAITLALCTWVFRTNLIVITLKQTSLYSHPKSPKPKYTKEITQTHLNKYHPPHPSRIQPLILTVASNASKSHTIFTNNPSPTKLCC